MLGFSDPQDDRFDIGTCRVDDPQTREPPHRDGVPQQVQCEEAMHADLRGVLAMPQHGCAQCDIDRLRVRALRLTARRIDGGGRRGRCAIARTGARRDEPVVRDVDGLTGVMLDGQLATCADPRGELLLPAKATRHAVELGVGAQDIGPITLPQSDGSAATRGLASHGDCATRCGAPLPPSCFARSPDPPRAALRTGVVGRARLVARALPTAPTRSSTTVSRRLPRAEHARGRVAERTREKNPRAAASRRAAHPWNPAMPRRPSTLLACCLATFAVPDVLAQSIVVRVGSDAACDASSLPGAIARLPALGPDVVHVIRLARNATYAAPATINNRSVVIEGGYATCAATAPAPDATTIGPMPTAQQRMLDILGSSTGAPYVVRLRNLALVGPAPAGGVRASGSVEVHLERARITGMGTPTLSAGGAVRLLSGAKLSMGDGDEISDNDACQGAGISAESSTVELGAAARVVANRARCQGGGVALFSSELLLRDDGGIPAQVSGNVAAAGGGIFALASRIAHGVIFAGGHLTVTSNEADRGGGLSLASTILEMSGVEVSFNRAVERVGVVTSGSCGGIDADQSSTIDLYDSALLANSATSLGGALCVNGRSRVTLVGGGPDCVGMSEECPRIAFNRATAGGVAWVTAASQLDFSPAVIHDNSARIGAIVRIEEAPDATSVSAVGFTNALVVRQRSTEFADLISADNTQVLIRRSTFADQSGIDAIVAGQPSRVTLSGNWFADGEPTTALRLDNFPIVTSTCNGVRPGDSSADPTGTSLLAAIPEFADRAAGDYRLRLVMDAQPPGIDRCQGPTGTSTDVGGRPRVVDFGAPGGEAGLMDLGAFEAQPSDVLPDALFFDGMEPFVPF